MIEWMVVVYELSTKEPTWGMPARYPTYDACVSAPAPQLEDGYTAKCEQLAAVKDG